MTKLASAGLVVITALVMAGCGGGGASTEAGSPPETSATAADANDSDRAFLATMSEHHAGGVMLGEIAQRLGKYPETKRLGESVATVQAQELEQMKAANQELFGEELVLEPMQDPAIVALEESDEFDRDFYDALIPHHQQAIEMARTEVADGENADLKALAQGIVDSQSKEIQDMNKWREKYYGETSPRGGVPPES